MSTPNREISSALRAVAYVRVSMAREGMISPELQMAAISEHCRRRGYQIVAVLEDLDLSGRLWRSRQIDAAIAMLETKQADTVVVWRWSRVTRNRLDWAVAVDRIQVAGGSLESATEPFDVDTATGRFARGMLAEFAAFESDRIGDVWREVRQRRVSLGLTPCGHEQFGYVKQGDSYAPHRTRGKVLADLYRRSTDGESFRSLAQWMTDHHYKTARPKSPNANVWSHYNLAMIMDRGFGAGYVSYKGVLSRGSHRAVITEAEWQAYLGQRELGRWHRRTDLDTFLMHGLLRCSCGSFMKPAVGHGRWKAAYVCRPHGGPARPNSTFTARQHCIDPLVLQWLCRVASQTPGHGDVAEEARAWADKRWRDARALTRRLQIEGLANIPLDRDERRRAESEALLIDPARMAGALVEDWEHLTMQERRTRLGTLAGGFVVDRTFGTVVLSISTVWGTEAHLHEDMNNDGADSRNQNNVETRT